MNKKYLLWALLFLMSVFYGYFLGNLDFFGFFDGRHEVNLRYLIGTIITCYFLTLSILFIDLTEESYSSIIYAIATILFVTIFSFSNDNTLAVIFAGGLFMSFVFIISTESRKRLDLFVKFVPSELFFPVVKRGFMFVVGMFAIINFFQSQNLVQNNSLISPALIKSVSRPAVVIFNKQLETQLRNQLGNRLDSTEQTGAKRQVVEFVLKSTVKSMLGNSSAKIGLDPDTIPVDEVIIRNNGEIDVSPVINAMADDLAVALNNWLKQFAFIAPFVVALATILILQPFMWPLEIVETIVSRCIFFLLLRLGFISLRKETREVERLSI